jgi:hypothetical protein
MLSGAPLQFSQKHTIRPYPKPVKSEVHKSLTLGNPGDSVCMVAPDTVDTITYLLTYSMEQSPS